MEGQRAWGRRSAAVVAAVLLAVGVLASPARAQDGGNTPYGGTSTTIDDGPEASCRLRARVLSPGETATAQVKAVARGTHVEIRFDGEVVAEEDASGPGSSPRLNMEIDFVVPADAGPGEHTVTAVAPSFTLSCQAPGGGDLEVRGASVERGDAGGSLPKTGVYIALLVVVALALLVAGRAFVEASRQRARAERREPRRRQHHSSRH